MVVDGQRKEGGRVASGLPFIVSNGTNKHVALCHCDKYT